MYDSVTNMVHIPHQLNIQNTKKPECPNLPNPSISQMLRYAQDRDDILFTDIKLECQSKQAIKELWAILSLKQSTTR